MNIKNEESSVAHYAIISYSHADADAVKSELDIFEENGVCYWYDNRMTGGMCYDTKFNEMLDKDNCKGIVFFVSDSFLLSDNCVKEMSYFKDKYGVDNPKKFCLVILPKGYPYKNADAIRKKVDQYVLEKNDAKISKQLEHLDDHIKLFLELNKDGKLINAFMNNADGHGIDWCCEEGQLFYNAEVISQLSSEKFGSFPQEQTTETDESYIKENCAMRETDKKPADYAPVDWFVIKNNILLSKKLLFAVDYLGLKYPFKKNDKTLEEQIRDRFFKHFRSEYDKTKIKVRFLFEKELNALLRRTIGDPEKRREVLLPKPTFFAQISNRKEEYAFWLAGDINDAQWVDAATGCLSEQKAGVEPHYVRVVIEIEK